MAPTADAIKPSANEVMFGKLGDRFKVCKGNDTQHSGFSFSQTNHESDGGCAIEILRGEDGREMVCDVRVPRATARARSMIMFSFGRCASG